MDLIMLQSRADHHTRTCLAISCGTAFERSLRWTHLPQREWREIFNSIRLLVTPIHHSEAANCPSARATTREGYIQSLLRPPTGAPFTNLYSVFRSYQPRRIQDRVQFAQERVDYLSSELNTLFRAIAARPGASKLRENDLEQVHETVNSFLVQHRKQA